MLQDTGVEPFVDRATDDSVTYPLVQDASEVVVVDRIKVALHINLEEPTASQLHRLFPQGLQHLGRGAVRAEAIRAG
jgi:hypothetical protein